MQVSNEEKRRWDIWEWAVDFVAGDELALSHLGSKIPTELFDKQRDGQLKKLLEECPEEWFEFFSIDKARWVRLTDKGLEYRGIDLDYEEEDFHQSNNHNNNTNSKKNNAATQNTNRNINNDTKKGAGALKTVNINNGPGISLKPPFAPVLNKLIHANPYQEEPEKSTWLGLIDILGTTDQGLRGMSGNGLKNELINRGITFSLRIVRGWKNWLLTNFADLISLSDDGKYFLEHKAWKEVCMWNEKQSLRGVQSKQTVQEKNGGNNTNNTNKRQQQPPQQQSQQPQQHQKDREKRQQPDNHNSEREHNALKAEIEQLKEKLRRFEGHPEALRKLSTTELLLLHKEAERNTSRIRDAVWVKMHDIARKEKNS